MKQKYMNMDMMKDEMKVMNNQNHRKKDLMMIVARMERDQYIASIKKSSRKKQPKNRTFH